MAGECGPPACGGAWSADGQILMGAGVGRLWTVSDAGGTPTDFLAPRSDEHFHRVYLLPEGHGALFDVDPDTGPGRVDAWDGERRVVVAEGAEALGYASGHAVFARDGSIWALPFSARRLEPTGDPFIVVAASTTASVSNDGSLLYRADVPPQEQLVWVARDGLVREVVDDPDGTISSPVVSSNGRVIAFALASRPATNGVMTFDERQIWTLEPRRGVRTPLTFESGFPAGSLAWGLDGNSLYYPGLSSGSFDDLDLVIRVHPMNGGVDRSVVPGYAPMVSSDGSYLVFSAGEFVLRDIHYLRLDGSSDPVAFSETPTMEAFPELSHDGHFIAYVASATGMTGTELYLSRFPSGEDRTRVSSDGGAALSTLRWAPDDTSLFYVRSSDGVMMEVDVVLGDEPSLSAPRELFDPRGSDLQLSAGFDVGPDGSRFLAVRRVVPRGAQVSRWVLKSNWLAGATR